MLNIITIMLYLCAAWVQASRFVGNRDVTRLGPLFILPALIFHGYLLYRWIDLSAGQNLTQFNLLSLALWVIAAITVLLSIKRPVEYIGTLLFPVAALSIILVQRFPDSHILQTSVDPKHVWHILLSVMTFSILLLAGLQAVTLALQDVMLKRRHFEISQKLPPLETMETLLFEMIAIGAIFLSLVLATSIYFFYPWLLGSLLQKTILTSLAWLVFVFLLVGRHYFGLRGRKAIFCTLSGVTILTITYFSSMLILELMP